MSVYLFKRLAGMIPLLFGITLISFAIMHVAPGEPTVIDQGFNPNVSAVMPYRQAQSSR